jgi:hypothetical protein
MQFTGSSIRTGRGIWSTSDDQEYVGYNVQQFASLLENCGFLSLIERPGMLRSGLLWTLEPGERPEVHFDVNRIQG